MTTTVETCTDPARLRAAGLEPVPGLTVYRIEGQSPDQVWREAELIAAEFSCIASRWNVPSRLDRRGSRWALSGYALHGETK